MNTSELPEKKFWSWATSLHHRTSQSVYIIYIFFEVAQLQIFENEVAQLQKFFTFLKVSRLNFNIYFEAREAIKTRWDRAFWNLTHEIIPVFYIFGSQLPPLHDIYIQASTLRVPFVLVRFYNLVQKFYFISFMI